jgi:hypothetical protein
MLVNSSASSATLPPTSASLAPVSAPSISFPPSSASFTPFSTSSAPFAVMFISVFFISIPSSNFKYSAPAFSVKLSS